MKERMLQTLLLSLMTALFLSCPALPAGLEIIDHKTEQEGLFNNSVTGVSPADTEGVFIASAGGLHILLDYFFLPVFQNIPAVAVAQDPDGDLWAAAAGGLVYRVVEREGIWSAVRIPFDPKKRITALTARHGAATIGTDSGLYYCGDPDGKFHTIMKRGTFTALAEAADGTVIAGYREAAHKTSGLLIIGGSFDSRTGPVDELAGKEVTALFIDNDRLLIGTRAGGLFVLDETGVGRLELPGEPGAIRALLVQDGTTIVAADGGLYAAAGGQPPALITAPDGPTPSGVTSLAPGPGGSLWVGTGADGVYLVRVLR
jgi:ligand-binding sensor domain-containing protein